MIVGGYIQETTTKVRILRVVVSILESIMPSSIRQEVRDSGPCAYSPKHVRTLISPRSLAFKLPALHRSSRRPVSKTIQQ
jgi:hypothetical protein